MRETTTGNRNRRASALVLLAVLALSCASPRSPQPELDEPAPVADSGYTMHATHLRSLMISLEQLTFKELPERLDPALTREQRLEEMQRVADELAEAAAGIPDGIAELELTGGQAHVFRWLATRLQADAINLRDRAAAGDMGAAQEELELILVRCNDCHRTFSIDPMGIRGPVD